MLIHYCKCPKCGYVTGVRRMYPNFKCGKCGQWSKNLYWDEYSASNWKQAYDEVTKKDVSNNRIIKYRW